MLGQFPIVAANPGNFDTEMFLVRSEKSGHELCGNAVHAQVGREDGLHGSKLDIKLVSKFTDGCSPIFLHDAPDFAYNFRTGARGRLSTSFSIIQRHSTVLES